MVEYDLIVAECATQGKALMRQLTADGQAQALYLYARPSTPGKRGRLMLARQDAPVPDGVVLVTGEGLRTNVPYDNYYAWIWDRARRAPVMSY